VIWGYAPRWGGTRYSQNKGLIEPMVEFGLAF